MNTAMIFDWAARTSLAALPLALAVLLLARVRFCQPCWRMWIAALFFLRLALPGVPETSWNVWSVTPASVVVEAVESDPLPAVAAVAAFDWKAALGWLWLVGVIVTLGWLVASHFITRRWIFRNAQPSLRWFDSLADWARERQGVIQRVPVVIVRGLSTMAIFGWLRPRLLIPADLADRYTAEQIRGMLLHEFAHVRRRDVLWTWLALLACALHWFNPLAWLAFRRFCADRELICDAAALAALDEHGRYSYGDALLRSLEVAPLSPAPSLAPFFRIHPEIKHRIRMITKPLQPTMWSRFAAALLVPALSLVAFTTSRAQSETEKPREGERTRSESREAERPGETERDEARSRGTTRDGEKPKESELDKYKRENAERKAERDGEAKREGARYGEGRRSAERDGDRPRDGERESDSRRGGDGEMKRGESRDGEARRSRDGDGERPREGARDGDSRRSAERDGDRSREGARDGEGRKDGPRDGEVKKDGPRDGETRKEGARDGERSREGSRDGDSEREKGDGDKRDGDRER